MRRVLMALALGLLSFQLANAQIKDVTTFAVQNDGIQVTFKVRYFAHNQPNIQEFLDGKAKVNGIIRKIVDAGLTPSVVRMDVGISPTEMQGGNVVIHKGALFVSLKATDFQIEGSLLSFFEAASAQGEIYFRADKSTSLAEMQAGKQKVEAILKRFSDNGLVLNLKIRSIAITAVKPPTGNIVEQESELLVSTQVTDDELERYFTAFIKR